MDVFQYLCCFTIIGFLNIFLVCTINIDKNIVLASVYDAMKSNVHPKNHNYNYNHKDNHNSAVSVKKMNLLSDLRDKRQDNEYYRRHGYYNDYDDFLQNPEKKCKEILRPQVVKFSIPDNSVSLATKFFHFLKVLLITIGAITLPVLILHALLLPLKVFVALKTVALANTLILGTLAYKVFHNSHHNSTATTTNDHHDYSDETDTDSESTNEYDDVHYDGETNEIVEEIENGDEFYTNKLKNILRSITRKNDNW